MDYWLATGGGSYPDNYSTRASSDSMGGTIWSSPTTYQNLVWYRVDILLDSSNGNSQKIWLVGQNSNNSQISTTWNIPVGINTQVNIGAGAVAGNPATQYMGYDDIYVDFTQARVEICDTLTWSARTHCEIQIPQTWVEGSIGIKANQGSFGSSDSAYLYVVDANGNVNANANGYSITIGGAADTTPPEPPSGVIVS